MAPWWTIGPSSNGPVARCPIGIYAHRSLRPVGRVEARDVESVLQCHGPRRPGIDNIDIDYRSFLERTPLVPWEADAHTWHFTYVGPQAVDLLGFPVTDWYEPTFWESRIHPSDRSGALSTCVRLSAEGGSYEFQYRMLRSDETVIWVNDIVSVEMGDTGPITLRGFLIDITESKSLSEALADSEMRAQLLLQATPDALLLVHSDGTILQYNRGAENLFDCSAGELMGSPIELLIPERFTNHADHRRAFSEAPRHRTMGEGLELIARRPDGSEFPVEISLSPFEYRGELQVLASVRDLTGRKRVASELRERERLLRHMATALPALIGFVDKNQRYQYVNDNYAAWFELDPSQIESRLVRDVVGESLYATLRPGIETALRGGLVHYETEFPSPDGSTCPVEMSLIPQFEAGGVVSGYFVVIFDISERVDARELERIHQEELAHVTRVATMGELAASIAHELNQPLTAIVTNGQAASRFLSLTPPDIAELDEALEDIAGDAKRAAAVIRRMRELLQRGEPRKEMVDVASLITETVEMLRSEAVARRVSVAVDCASDVSPVMGDPIQLKQVVINLMVNAFEVASEGDDGVGALVITASASDGQVLITFTDNGAGLPDDPEQNFFAPFVSSKAAGLGMGLSISRTVVETHGGRLTAENNPDGGARFQVLLPVNIGEEE